MQVTVHEAKTHLSKLIRAVEAGEDVVIARGDKPVIRMILANRPAPRFRLGILEGIVAPPPPEFYESLTDEEMGLTGSGWDDYQDADRHPRLGVGDDGAAAAE